MLWRLVEIPKQVGQSQPPRPVSADPLTARVLTKGEALGAPSGRADDFSWPRGNVATVKADQEAPPAVAAKPATAPAPKPGPVAAATPQRSELEPPAEPLKPRRQAPPQQRPAPFTPFSLFR